MLSDDFAITCEDDAASSHHAAPSVEGNEALSAAEPVGTVGGRPVPAPAADPYVGLEPGEAAMDRFVDDYLQLLDGRLDTIRRCLDDSDVEGARVALLSLESSSVMLGGTVLAARLAELRAELDLGSTPQRNALLALAEVAAAAFRRGLEGSTPV